MEDQKKPLSKMTKKELLEEINKRPERAYDISGNSFVGVHWDADALHSVGLVAQGLKNLTELFKTQNVKINSLLRVNPEQEPHMSKSIGTLKGSK